MILKKIRFIFINIFRVILTHTLLALPFFASKKYIVFGLRDFNGNEQFLHNSKYLYLYLKNTEYKCIWLTNDSNAINILNQRGYIDVYTRYSLQGIYYALFAKFWICDFSTLTDCISCLLPLKTIKITPWHGIPLKKIEFDTKESSYYRLNNIEKFFYRLLRSRYDYFLTNGTYDNNCFKSAFDVSEKQLITIGNPRLDALYNNIKDSEIFMEKDFKIIYDLYNIGKKLIFYVPTYRLSQKDISGWLKSQNLNNFLKQNNAVLVCKLHYADKNSLNFKLTENFYKLNNNSDIYPILKYSKALITDYSSVYFDYLLLNKPIIYYPLDLNEYQSDVGFYGEYEKLTAGIKVYNEDELISALQDVINDIDKYKKDRKQLCNEMFKYRDAKNCERFEQWIKSLM